MLQLLKIIHLRAEIIKIITLKAFIYIDEPPLLKKNIFVNTARVGKVLKSGWKTRLNTLNSAQDAVWRI